jgi:ribosomal protein L40E
MVCPNCQFNNPGEAKFCNNCGYRLEALAGAVPA